MSTMAKQHSRADRVREYAATVEMATVPVAAMGVLVRAREAREWAAPEPERPSAPAEPPAFGIPDFHATVARLREHPTVLLDLGLVFEVIVDVADLDVGAARDHRRLAHDQIATPADRLQRPERTRLVLEKGPRGKGQAGGRAGGLGGGRGGRAGHG